ncbi:dorsal-ventral patterning tolloid-like protein 1 [Ruditapes philippinarum]|uniref:dorsal-ventral patterning tolloid-like protein 1 n=1 Tax=Ruditapes philippinarum TaxID=129788 RepID=UPI00295AF786|nr:dorsal-ventral patterning tolloid-like protein 1 [Ruditapes philippinarum]
MKGVFLFLIALILYVSSVNASHGTDVFCGEHIDIIPNKEVEITTPNFPDVYPHYLNCTWTFCTVNQHIIVLDFFIFQLEDDSDCDSFDYVNIYDGKYIGQNLIATYCGDYYCEDYDCEFYPFEEIKSTGRCMTLYFHTDGSVQLPGFLARINSMSGACM